jgi:hypothetical protein
MQKVKTDTLTKGCRQVESALLGELSKPSNLHVQQPMKPDIRLADSYVTRRSWMKMAAGMAATGLLPRQMAAQSGTAAGSATSDSIVASDSAAIAGTTHGRVRGFMHKEMFIFRGIPYGAPTSGTRRFMAPAKPAPWTGVRSALAWGFASPQIPPEHWDKDEVDLGRHAAQHRHRLPGWKNAGV